jgi:hypothetical protein
MSHVLVALLLCALTGGQGGQAQAQSGQAKSEGKESVRVYVFPTESADHSTTDAAQQARLTAVHELQEAIRKKVGLSVVDDRSQADVIVEVLDREEDSAGEGGFGGVKLTALVNTTIRLHVTARDLQTDIKGLGPGGGSKAAKDAAERLFRWVVRNHLDR